MAQETMVVHDVDAWVKPIRIGIQQRLSSSFVETARVNALMDIVSDDLVLAIVQKVYGKTLQKVEATYPIDWWQGIRERWFPRWWLKRHPVIRYHVELLATAYYPQMEKMPKEFGPGYLQLGMTYTKQWEAERERYD